MAVRAKHGFDAKTITRFWTKVTKRSKHECWEWDSWRYSTGYGGFEFKSGLRHKHGSAHRLMWTIVNGPIPKGLYVLHRCDNRPCVNPDHLFLGTCQDNIRDAVAKGRFRNSAILTEHQVRKIRKAHAAGTAIARLAKRYGLTYQCIYAVIRRKSWADIE